VCVRAVGCGWVEVDEWWYLKTPLPSLTAPPPPPPSLLTPPTPPHHHLSPPPNSPYPITTPTTHSSLSLSLFIRGASIYGLEKD
jgi:hypothetical protein